jgi:hypothetical protein
MNIIWQLFTSESYQVVKITVPYIVTVYEDGQGVVAAARS